MSSEANYLSAIPSALIAVDRSLAVRFINAAAEDVFGISAQQAIGRALSTFPAFDDALCALCENIFASGEAVSLFEQTLRIPMQHRVVTMHITPVWEEGEARARQLLIAIEKSDGIDRLAASEWKQETTRAAGVMAAMLAHEVKNPLSGIRGAAQLLRDEVPAEHQPLTDLICNETDRISDLLTQVEVFANGAPELSPVNIHEVLQYVIGVAQTGFARHVTFRERYDPSLPMVSGHRDLLVQMFLNLIKNAAEALAGSADATITLSTAYKSGLRMRVDSPSPLEGEAERLTNDIRMSFVEPFRVGGSHRGNISSVVYPSPGPSLKGRGKNRALPIVVAIEDNGAGIPEAMRERLFEPFVSSKEDGRGLGLAIVAKIASDMGAVAELDRECQTGTKFLVWLAVSDCE